MISSQAFAEEADWNGYIKIGSEDAPAHEFFINQPRTLNGTIDADADDAAAIGPNGSIIGFPEQVNGKIIIGERMHHFMVEGKLEVGTIENHGMIIFQNMHLNGITEITNDTTGNIDINGPVYGDAKSFINRGRVHVGQDSTIVGAEHLTITNESGFVQPEPDTFGGNEDKKLIWSESGTVEDNAGIADVQTGAEHVEEVINEKNSADTTLFFLKPDSNAEDVTWEDESKPIRINLSKIEPENKLLTTFSSTWPEGVDQKGKGYYVQLDGEGTLENDSTSYSNSIMIAGNIAISCDSEPAQSIEVCDGGKATFTPGTSGSDSITVGHIWESGGKIIKYTHETSGQTWTIEEKPAGKLTIPAGVNVTIGAMGGWRIDEPTTENKNATLPSDLENKGTGADYAEYKQYMTAKDIDSITYAVDGINAYVVQEDGKLKFSRAMQDSSTHKFALEIALDAQEIRFLGTDGESVKEISLNLDQMNILVQNNRYFIPQKFGDFFEHLATVTSESYENQTFGNVQYSIDEEAWSLVSQQ